MCALLKHRMSVRCATKFHVSFAFVARLAAPLPLRHLSSWHCRLVPSPCRRHAVRLPSLADATKACLSIPGRTCHARRARRLASRHSLGPICFIGPFSCLQIYSLIFCMFPLSSFCPSLVSLFFSFPHVALAIGLRVSSLFFNFVPAVVF